MGLSRLLLVAFAACSYSPPDAGETPGSDAPLNDSMVTDTAADTASDTPSDTQPPPVFCDDTDATLRACYRFENTADDASQFGNDASTSSVSFEPGKVGDAIVVDANALVDIPEDPSLDVDNLTVEMWVRMDSIPSSSRVALLDNEGQYAIFVLAGGGIDWSIVTTNGAIRFTAGTVGPVGQFRHLAMTYDGISLRAYVGGTQVGIGAGVTGPIQPFPSLGTTLGYNNGGGDHLLGAFDDVRIWSVARSAAQIAAAAL